MSKDEFDSDFVIDKGKYDRNSEKKVSFKIDTDEMESVKSSHDPIMDSSQETVQTTVTQMTTDTELTVTLIEDTHDDEDDDYPPLSQNLHRTQYIKRDDSSDLEWKWSELEQSYKGKYYKIFPI